MTVSRLLLSLSFALALPIGDAAANAARPITYDTKVDGTTVRVCPVNFDSRGCPDPGGMLRENEESGEVVRLAETCEDGCYVDECVPPGTYRYGFARPYECGRSSAYTSYYVTVQVPEAEGTCSRAADRPAPSAHDARTPWRRDPEICHYRLLCGACAMAPSPGQAVLGALGLVIGLALLRRRSSR
ncbi:MAG TPA: hypothetical protein VFG69_02510 [Nannocystaceae bacterium]|nr:hypothetical protein [Nannocystaceae bacterium]